MSEPVLCKDCVHSFQIWYDRVTFANPRYTLRCRKAYKEQEVEKNLVTEPKPVAAHYETCSVTRLNSSVCKEEGLLWQPKDRRHLFKYIKRV